MPDDQDGAGLRRTGPVPSRTLSPELIAGLRTAFAGEVDRRLPRLRRLRQDPDRQLLAQALRDAHSLASSAAVVGAGELSRCAAQVETGLQRCLSGTDVGLPAPVAADAERLTALLEAWRPA